MTQGYQPPPGQAYPPSQYAPQHPAPPAYGPPGPWTPAPPAYGPPGPWTPAPQQPAYGPPPQAAPHYGPPPGAPPVHAPQGYAPQAPQSAYYPPPDAMPNDSIYDSVAGANVYQRTPYFPLGEFIVDIDEVKPVVSKAPKTKGQSMVIVLATIVTTNVAGIQAGNQYSQAINLDKYGLPDFKAFLAACYGVDPTKPEALNNLASQGLLSGVRVKEILGPAQPFGCKRKRLRLVTFMASSGKFTKHAYAPLQSAAPPQYAPPQGNPPPGALTYSANGNPAGAPPSPQYAPPQHYAAAMPPPQPAAPQYAPQAPPGAPPQPVWNGSAWVMP